MLEFRLLLGVGRSEMMIGMICLNLVAQLSLLHSAEL